MKTKELATIASKITGIAYILVAIGRLPDVVIQYVQFVQLIRQAPVSEANAAFMTVPGLSCALILIAGLILLLQGNRIGSLISTDDSPFLPSIDADTFLGLGIAVVGAWVMAASLPVVAEKCASMFIAKRMGLNTVFSDNYRAGLFGSSLKVVIGLWMFLGSMGLVGIRNRLRGGRTHSEAQPSDAPRQ